MCAVFGPYTQVDVFDDVPIIDRNWEPPEVGYTQPPPYPGPSIMPNSLGSNHMNNLVGVASSSSDTHANDSPAGNVSQNFLRSSTHGDDNNQQIVPYTTVDELNPVIYGIQVPGTNDVNEDAINNEADVNHLSPVGNVVALFDANPIGNEVDHSLTNSSQASCKSRDTKESKWSRIKAKLVGRCTASESVGVMETHSMPTRGCSSATQEIVSRARSN